MRLDAATLRTTKVLRVGRSGLIAVATGLGSLWALDESSGTLDRIDPAANAVTARIAGTNTARRLATLPADAPERMVLAAGRLWITGRGTDLLEFDPGTGSVLSTVDIGASGIDVVAHGDTIWVPNRDAATDPTGFPTMEALRRVDARSGAVTAATAASGPLDVHGLFADDRGVWLADNTHGVLYRVPG